jgi:hypothetical protein
MKKAQLGTLAKWLAAAYGGNALNRKRLSCVERVT